MPTRKSKRRQNVSNSLGKGEFEIPDNSPYVIEKSETFGRYLAAARDLPSKELILEEAEPLVVGPVQQSKPICVGCYAPIPSVLYNYKCECDWPCCGPDCPGMGARLGHSTTECEYLAKIPFSYDERDAICNIYNVVVPLRCLLLKGTPAWKFLRRMESHDEERERIPSIWRMNQITVVDLLDKFYETAEIHTICGILEVNCFEITTKYGVSVRGLYPTAFLLAHDCIPNTVHTNDADFKLKIRTSIPIAKGKPITLSYAYTMHGTMKRRKHLKETKFFDCACERCRDPTECGSHASTLVCPACSRATLLSSNPLDAEAVWVCSYKKCTGFEMPSAAVGVLLNKIEDEISSISGDNANKYENIIKTQQEILHRNHYLLVGIKSTLNELYGKSPKYPIREMSEDLLKRKIDICESLLAYANVVEPGFSRMRGVTLYELHAPIMILTTRKYNENKQMRVSKKMLKHSLKRVVSYLEEVKEILGFECEFTPEGKIAAHATEALSSAQQWQKILGKF